MLLSSPTDPDCTNLPRQAGRSGPVETVSPARPKFLTRTCYKGGHVLRPGLRVDTHGCPARRPARADRPLPSLPAEDSPLSPDAGAEGRRGSRLRGVARHRSRSDSVRRYGERPPLLDLHDRAAPADRSPAGSNSATHRPRQRGDLGLALPRNSTPPARSSTERHSHAWGCFRPSGPRSSFSEWSVGSTRPRSRPLRGGRPEPSA